MPLYEYRCLECGHKFEKIQKFNAEPQTVCPKCGGELYRPLTAPAFQFKGAGWYVNDYAPKATSGSAEKSAADSGKTPAADSKPAETKPAAAESAPKPAAAPSTSSTT